MYFPDRIAREIELDCTRSDVTRIGHCDNSTYVTSIGGAYHRLSASGQLPARYRAEILLYLRKRHNLYPLLYFIRCCGGEGQQLEAFDLFARVFQF